MKHEWVTKSSVERMRADWEQRARENARYYVATSRDNWTEEEFYRSGETNLREYVLSDLENVCQDKDPKSMNVLEIGCGAGRITRALASCFGKVYAVDISAEMVRQARAALAAYPNARIFRNNGKDLSVVRENWRQLLRLAHPPEIDFAFSYIVFQHIPSREVIESYVSEVHRLLRPGGLFKFQVLGASEFTSEEPDTWVGVSFSENEARAMAARHGFEMRYCRSDRDEQYLWLWFFKRSEEDLLRLGRLDLENHILQDLENVCQGKDPRQMSVLELGRGDGSMSRALAELFGRVHTIEPGQPFRRTVDFALAKDALAETSHLENHLRQVACVLRPGGLFKCRVASGAFSGEEGRQFAQNCGFDLRHRHQWDDETWVWLFRRV